MIYYAITFNFCIFKWTITTAKDKAQTFFSPKTDDYNNTTKRMLAKYGNIPIESMAIYRTPLPSLLSKTINVLSLGQWNKLQKKYGFDKFYHLALVITLKSGKNIIVEKNEVIEVKDSYKTNSDTETLPTASYSALSRRLYPRRPNRPLLLLVAIKVKTNGKPVKRYSTT